MFRRRDDAHYGYLGSGIFPVVSPCANGHFPESVMCGATPDGPWLCRSCQSDQLAAQTRATVAPALALVRFQARAGRYPPPGSTPPITEYEAVMIENWGRFQPIRYGLLFPHTTERKWDFMLGIAS